VAVAASDSGKCVTKAATFRSGCGSMRSEISIGLRSYGRGFAVRPSDDPPDELPDDKPLDDGDPLDEGGGSGDRLGRSRAVGPGDEPPGCV
jgi:hypothetical protein